MADHVARRAPRPDLILCSTALRTRQTLAPLVKRLGSPAPPIALEEGLYLATEDMLLTRLRAVPDDASTVLMIGHNDGMWHFAEALAGRGAEAQRDALRQKFPTGTLATLAVSGGSWADLAWGCAELLDFVRPRDLVAN